jgi:hypothetical protein
VEDRSRAGRPAALAGLGGLADLHVEGTTTSAAPQVVVFVDSLVTADGATKHDFGRVLEGAPNQCEFVLENVSDEPVAIARLNSTCKCSVGDLSRASADGTRSPYELASPIAPGEKLVVRAGLVTAEQRGRLNHAVTLIHASGGATRLEVTADVVPFFTTEPAHGALMLGKLRRTQSATGTLVVRTGDGRPVRLEYDAAEVSPLVFPRLTPVAPDADGRSAQWQVEVTVGPVCRKRSRRRSASLCTRTWIVSTRIPTKRREHVCSVSASRSVSRSCPWSPSNRVTRRSASSRPAIPSRVPSTSSSRTITSPAERRP